MYFTKAAALVLLPLTIVSAAPYERREPGVGDFIGSIFDDATSDVASVFDHATGVVGSVVGVATSVVDSALVSATASSIFKEATSVLGTQTSSAFATIITANGEPVVEVTSVGGPAITLAPKGTTTSFLGHTFTIATSSASSTSSSSPSSSSNAALGSASGLSKSSLIGVAGVVGSILLGAIVVV